MWCFNFVRENKRIDIFLPSSLADSQPTTNARHCLPLEKLMVTLLEYGYSESFHFLGNRNRSFVSIVTVNV